MVDITNRAGWHARPPSRPMPKGTYPESTAFIHHEAGALFLSLQRDDEQRRMRDIQSYDMNVRGYADIPYSFCAFPSGRACEGRDYTWDDSATGGSNGTSISICFPGNYQVQYPTSESLDAAAELIVFGIRMGQLTANCRILGHREAPGAATACPGINLFNSLSEIRSRVAKLLTPTPVPVGGLMSVLAVVIPTAKTGIHKDGRFAFYSHGDKEIFGWNGASLAGDQVVPPTTNEDSAQGRGCRKIDVPTSAKIIGIMYGTRVDGVINYSSIVACASDGGTFAYQAT